MRLSILLYLLLAFSTFFSGISIVELLQTETEAPDDKIATNVKTVDLPSAENSDADGEKGTASLCVQEDPRLLKMLVATWLSGSDVENVAYCLRPSFVDLDEDGRNELAVKYFCSGTGNCSMKIYKQDGDTAREIFSDRQAVSYYDKVGGSNKGYRDLQTRSHGSCCDGDQVVYRYNGRRYQPLSCAEYSYWYLMQAGQKEGPAIITKRSCQKVLD